MKFFRYFKRALDYFSDEVAIDLGTANSKVYVKGEGLILKEPSIVAINQKTGQIVAVGEEAKKMVGRTPAHILAVRPLRAGVVSDFEVTELMIKYFLEKVRKKKLIGPRLIIAVPCGLTEVEKRAVLDAGKGAGAREVYLIEEPLAAAIGARLAVTEPCGNFIVDIGGGTSEIAVIALGGIVLSRVLRLAGDRLNEDIVNYLQQEYKILIGERTAEEAKITTGCVLPQKEKKEFVVRGRDLTTGLPAEKVIDSDVIRKAMEKTIRQIIHEIKMAIEQTPPELIADVLRNGIFLSGGGALLSGLDALISKETGVKVKVVEDPQTAVVRGAGIVLENLKDYADLLLEKEEMEVPK